MADISVSFALHTSQIDVLSIYATQPALSPNCWFCYHIFLIDTTIYHSLSYSGWRYRLFNEISDVDDSGNSSFVHIIWQKYVSASDAQPDASRVGGKT